MKSWKIARVAGIDVSVHWSFLLLLGWVAFSAFASGGVVNALFNLQLVIAVFGCVVLHELGHAMAARQFGIATRGITLLPIGGVASLDRMPRRPLQELWIAVAGPLVNVFIAAALVLVIPLSQLTPLGLFVVSPVTMLQRLFWINVGLVLFNMLPAFPMDGGRVLRATLALVLPYVDATRIAAGVGKVMAVLLGIVGLFKSPMLLLVAVFVYLAGSAEARMVEAEQQPSFPPTHFPPAAFDFPSTPNRPSNPTYFFVRDLDGSYRIVDGPYTRTD